MLAAIVFTIAVGMIDLRRLRDVYRESRGEFYLAVTTAAAVAGVGVEQGIPGRRRPVAVEACAPQLSAARDGAHVGLGRAVASDAREAGPRGPSPGLVIYSFGADLFYANVNRFVDEVQALVAHAPTPVRCFLVEAAAITDIDYSAAQALHDLLDDMAGRGVVMMFARVSLYLRADMDRHRLIAAIGEARLFATLHEAVAAARARMAAGAPA
ncbi:MAG: sodium-independent anion transporter [Pseudomonadota bacterium]